MPRSGKVCARMTLARAESDEVKHVLRIFAPRSTAARAPLFARAARRSSARVAHVDQQHGLAVGGEFLALNGKIFRRLTQPRAPLQCVHQGLADIRRRGRHSYSSCLPASRPATPDSRSGSPQWLVEHLKDLRSALSPILLFLAQLQALARADEVAILFNMFSIPLRYLSCGFSPSSLRSPPD
jgi:hypothetical protein